MFDAVTPAPPDPILGLSETFKQDPNPDKINLSVGVYQDGHGKTPVLASVKQAEKILLEQEASKTYRPIDGAADYARCVQHLVLGADHPALAAGRVATAHTPGGTGALRVAGDYLHRLHPDATLWMSDPTWANHPNIFAAANVPTKKYPYFDPATNGLDFEGMLAALKQIPAGDVVLLHACCHNPSGVDPTAEQWEQIGQVLAQRGVLPLVDFAYQGFGDGLKEDALGVRTLLAHVDELLVCSSFSKNFSLYNERVGALTLVAAQAEHAKAVLSQVKKVIRANYSNPPAHGASIVSAILQDEALTRQWMAELDAMRDRINGMRALFARTLEEKDVPGDPSFIIRQRGMFSFSGLSSEQVKTLRDDYSIYIVNSGRINVAGMNETNMERLCDAIAAVMQGVAK